jgi:catechol 2,3-dioxygenase-like lactoylglutathione lyase family enzyme
MSPSSLSHAVGCIDHIVIVVDDLDRDADTYRRLGFTLSPKGVHSAALGSANHTIMLQRDYFELLTVLAPTDRNIGWREALAAGGGVAGMAMTTENAAAAYDYWRAQGFAPEELIRFARTVKRPQGPDMEARFEVVSLPNPPGAGLRLFVCSQPTREAVWLPELLTHANSAQAILGVTIAAPDPAASSQDWRRLLPGVVATQRADGVRLTIGPHFIDLISPQVAQSRYGSAPSLDRPRPVAIAFSVSDIGCCQALFEANGTRFTTSESGLLVPREAACGTALTFIGRR